MKRLYILYDRQCGICRELMAWMKIQPAYLELHLMPSDSPDAMKTFPEFAKPGKPEELIVISDEGAVYRDVQAYIMCLYALEEYREWAMRLASPALLPLARQACRFLSRNRAKLSDWLGMEKESRLAERLQAEWIPPCNRKEKVEGNRVCPFCHGPVNLRDAVYCPECSCIHHRECWVANNYHCSIFGCDPAGKFQGAVK